MCFHITDYAKSRIRLLPQSGAVVHELHLRMEDRHTIQMRRDIYGKQRFSGG